MTLLAGLHLLPPPEFSLHILPIHDPPFRDVVVRTQSVAAFLPLILPTRDSACDVTAEEQMEGWRKRFKADLSAIKRLQMAVI